VRRRFFPAIPSGDIFATAQREYLSVRPAALTQCSGASMGEEVLNCAVEGCEKDRRRYRALAIRNRGSPGTRCEFPWQPGPPLGRVRACAGGIAVDDAAVPAAHRLSPRGGARGRDHEDSSSR